MKTEKKPMFSMSPVKNIVAMGCSTGGPKALYRLIPQIPGDIDSTVLVVQHMPPGFTASVAEGLNERSSLIVKEAVDNDELKNGVVYIAPGGCQMRVSDENGQYTLKVCEKTPDSVHNPSVNILFESLVGKGFKKIIAVILTGMGDDGSRGIIRIKEEKCSCVIAQDEKTSVVYGMPRSAIKTGKVDSVVPIDEIAEKILYFLGV